MMNTSSNRHQFQEVIERYLGCPDPSQLKSYKSTFEAMSVSDALSSDLTRALKQDVRSTYYKAAISIAEAMVSIRKGYHSWAVIKLYYASFYLVRVAYAVRGYGIFRCGTLYTLHVSRNSQPIKRSGKGDHKVILNAFIKDYEGSEILLSNKINGQHTFEWLMGKRETVNYRDATFSEPGLSHFESSLSNGSLDSWITTYLNDASSIYCFLEDHAGLAVPLCFCRQILDEATDGGLVNLLSQDQQDVIATLLGEACTTGIDEIKALLVR
ncbi:hypothetical protein [Sphingomonas sp. BK481]|uniref:hypothetical protein n=1 Tax=Sphingomonas sp. BK481 TaxID=2586981 RepID=UPI00161B33AE|nr:hypothetical protein [Sphingomonas sp. BK481]MBB3589378.1 hypothetical protein [Sphingomonas sp. BK481]